MMRCRGKSPTGLRQRNLKSRSILLSPSPVKRPDFEAVMVHQDRESWKKDGKENGNCFHLRRRWERIQAKNRTLFSHSLRIHFSLPEVRRFDNDTSRLFVDEDDSIVAYILKMCSEAKLFEH
eukprot:scaffold294_cov221-Amphora_coffeaeformis.AAC.36